MAIKTRIRVSGVSVCGLRSAVCGFTLIELLVAMGILMVIVLMMANLFQQSTRSWEGGMRQAEVGLEARAVVNMIQDELSQAVASPNLDGFIAGGDELQFYTLGRDASTTNRQFKRVRYARSGRVLQKTTWIAENYGQLGSSPVTVDLVSNVERFEVSNSLGAASPGTNVPDWVGVRLEVAKDSSISEVRIWSAGRDGIQGTDDDRLLRTWRE